MMRVCFAHALLVVSLLQQSQDIVAQETQPTNLGLRTTYWVTFSKNIRRGMTLPVTVHLVNVGAVSSVSVSLRNSPDENIIFAETPSVTITGGTQGHVIELQIPRNLKKLEWNQGWFIVRVIANGDVSFNQSAYVNFIEKAFSVFVQTDKAVYEPGDTVKFRTLAMNPDLTVLNEPMDISIRDPLGNRIKQWKNVAGVANTGVVEKSLPTSSEPPLGDWKIDVTVLDYTETKTFTIDKYVIPKFEVAVEVPNVVLTSASALEGKAVAKYAFEKPLSEAQVLVTVQFPYYKDRYGSSFRKTLTQTGTLNEKGEFHFLFSTEDLLELAWVYYYNNPGFNPLHPSPNHISLEVIVNVTDVRTGSEMGAVGEVQFRQDRVDINFWPISTLYYKPGLKYIAYVSVTKPDGSLFEDYQNIIVTFNITYMAVKITYTAPQPNTITTTASTTTMMTPSNDSNTILEDRPAWIPYVYQEEMVLSVVNKTLTTNGFVELEVDVPSIAESVFIEATALGANRSHSAYKSGSDSGNYIQILADTSNPQIGQTARFNVRTTESVDTVICQLYTKGIQLSESEAQTVDPLRQEFTVSFPVTESMAPYLKILVFYFRSDRKVVADCLSIKIERSSAHRVNVTYNKQTVKPGEDVQLIVKAQPESVVFLLGVDESVQPLKSGNDITSDMVDKELIQYDFGGYFSDWEYMSITRWPYQISSSHIESIFSIVRVALLTDNSDKNFGTWMFASGSTRDADLMSYSGPAGPAEHSAPVEKVRKFFPERWLWHMVIMGSESQQVLTVTAPDTISTWPTSAFAIHPQYGLSAIERPAELTTFQPVFVSLDLPYSAVRGEDLCLKAFAFNYYNDPIFVTLVMDRTEGISNIRLIRSSNESTTLDEERVSMQVSHNIGQVNSNEIGETAFCFTPTRLGNLLIQVNLTTTTIAGDGVERLLLVEPEGVPRVQAVQVILDISNGQPVQHVVPIAFPNDTVQGSQRIAVAVAGDFLAPVFENIDNLLRLPYGCGEQNMLFFVLNIYLIQHLQLTHTYTAERAEKAEYYMLVGYQKEIKYQHRDGSYSTFGAWNKNSNGSMWLTAFVTKCFVQSIVLGEDVISVDPNFVRMSISWMISYQHENGSFPEPGKVFNKNMQGGSAEGEALTAYVLIALGEADVKFEELSSEAKKQLQEAIFLARAYLEQQLDSLDDSYDLAIVTYALHLTNSPLADQALDRLLNKAINGPLTLHWERPKPEQTPHYYYWQRQTDAINIEATAYALLTVIAREDVASSLPIVRWLTSQRGPEGGFISTQDTVIGLQALAQFAAVIYRPTDSPITVTVQWTVNGQQETRQLTLDESTELLLQRVVLPVEENSIPADITITASSPVTSDVSGLAVAEVILDYNVLEATIFTTFTMVPEVQIIDDNNFVLRLTATRIDNKTGGMTVIEVGIPTGYSVDESNALWDISGSKMAEQAKKKYIIYYDELGADTVNATLPMTVTNGIPVNTQPAAITIYDYYENGGDQQLTVYYELSTGNSICDRQPKYENCAMNLEMCEYLDFANVSDKRSLSNDSTVDAVI